MPGPGIADRDSSAAPGGHDASAGDIGPGPPAIGSNSAEFRQKSKNRDPPPTCCRAEAWAMFLSNNYVKNDMVVSRETIA